MKKKTPLLLSLVLTFILMLGIGGIAQALGQMQTYIPIVVNNYPEPPTPTTPPPGSDPLPGEWHGSGENFLLDFTVSNDSSEVTDISGTFWCGSYRTDFWIYPPSAIKRGEFDAELPQTVEIHGKFGSSTTVTGTWTGWAGYYSCNGNWAGTPK